MLQKLIAIGGAVEEESFEVQVKAQITDEKPILTAIANKDLLTVIRKRIYHEYEHYFPFDDDKQGRLRYREDEFLDDKGNVTNARARLTLTGIASEGEFGSVLLSRSRYFAPANHSLRFYREYFKPTDEREIEKKRQRWLVVYHGVEFFINLDRILRPDTEGFFLEIKARTWSRKDAKDKAAIATELLTHFGASHESAVKADYVELLDSDFND